MTHASVQSDQRYLADPAATLALGAELADLLASDSGYGKQALVFLHGDLGAGKTTLVRGLLRRLGYQGAVKSPTYTLVEPYAALPVYHLDLYRIEDDQELDFIGIDELLGEPGIKLVEWPERGARRLPAPDLSITLEFQGPGRSARIQA